MKLLQILIFASLSAISTTTFPQKVEVDVSACYLMDNILTNMKSGSPKEKIISMLDSALGTKPYQTMFKHYNRPFRPNHLPISVFKRMILSLQFPGEYLEKENQRADQMLVIWKTFYQDLDIFHKNIKQIKEINLTTTINKAVKDAQSWLPDDWQISDFYLFIHPDGGSVAFAIDNAQGYDFFRLPRDSSGTIIWSKLVGVIAHESHHLGINGKFPCPMSSSDSVSYSFLSFFVGEGTATKFVDNAPGGCMPAINELEGNEFTNDILDLWKSYALEESDLFKHMIDTFEKLYSGELTEVDLNNEIRDFWLSGIKGPVYFLGSELFGAIYLAFGKERTFEAMKDPRKIFQLYNEALTIKPELFRNCFLIPDSTVYHALMIGHPKK